MADFFDVPPEMFFAEPAQVLSYRADLQRQPASDALENDFEDSTDDLPQFDQVMLPFIGDDLDARLNDGDHNIHSFVPSENGLAAYLSKATDIVTMEQPPMAVSTSLRKRPQFLAESL